MEKKKLIIFEGADNLGKTTQAKLLQKQTGYKYIKQPDDSGTLGFLRKELKHGLQNITPTERQLIHTCQNVVDLFEQFDGKEDIIMDRSYISTLVYGKAQGVGDGILDLIYKIQSSLWLKHLADRYDVNILFFTPTSENALKYIYPDSSDYYESSIDYIMLDSYYIQSMNTRGRGHYFHKEEKLDYVYINGKDSIKEMNATIREAIGLKKMPTKKEVVIENCANLFEHSDCLIDDLTNEMKEYFNEWLYKYTPYDLDGLCDRHDDRHCAICVSEMKKFIKSTLNEE